MGDYSHQLVKASPSPTVSASTRALIEASVVQTDNGLQIPAAVIQRIREERARGFTIAAVPTTPRFVNRNGGGVAVEKGSHRAPTVSIQALRHIRERGPIFQAIHAARAYQVRRMARRWNGKKGHVGWRVVHKDHVEHNATPPPSFQKYIDAFERMLKKPCAAYDCKTTGTLLSKLEEDFLTINRPCVEVMYGLFDPDHMVGFRPVDGGIVWPTLAWLQKWKSENPKWHGRWQSENLTTADQLEIASGVIGHDLFVGEYALVRDGILEGVYRSDKMMVAPLENRTDIEFAGYPPSHVEQALELGIGFINAWDYNANYFTRGMMAEFILGVPHMLADEDVDAFIDGFREASQGVAKAHQPPILPLPPDGDIKKIDLKSTNKEMLYEMWLGLTMSLCAAVYRMDPTAVNAKPWDGGSGPSLSAPNRNLEIALAKEEGLQGDLQHFVDHFLDPLAQRVHPDLQVVFEYGDVDPAVEVDLYDKRSKIEMTRNEVRLEQGMQPRGFWVPDDEYEKLSEEDRAKYDSNLWNMPADSVFVQAKQQEAMMAADAAQGPDGSDDDGQDDPNDFGTPGYDGDELDDEPMAKAVRRRVTVTTFDL